MKLLTLLLLFHSLCFAIIPEDTQEGKDLYLTANTYNKVLYQARTEEMSINIYNSYGNRR